MERGLRATSGGRPCAGISRSATDRTLGFTWLRIWRRLHLARPAAAARPARFARRMAAPAGRRRGACRPRPRAAACPRLRIDPPVGKSVSRSFALVLAFVHQRRPRAQASVYAYGSGGRRARRLLVWRSATSCARSRTEADTTRKKPAPSLRGKPRLIADKTFLGWSRLTTFDNGQTGWVLHGRP